MNFKHFSLAALLLGGVPAAFGSTHISVGVRIGVPLPVIVRRAPPPRVVETVVVSPGPAHVWVAGHYSWSNEQWVWVPGAWVLPPEPGAMWIEGSWDEATKKWTEGYWQVTRPAEPAAPPPASPPSTVATPAPAPAVVVTTPAPSTTVIIRSAPPPPRREHRGHRPGRGFVWIDGYWRFDGHRHVWIAGYWTRPPHGHRVWVAPRWEHRGGTYVFIEGRWR